MSNVNDVALVFLSLTLNIFKTSFQCFYCWLEQVNVSWVTSLVNQIIKVKKIPKENSLYSQNMVTTYNKNDLKQIWNFLSSIFNGYQLLLKRDGIW